MKKLLLSGVAALFLATGAAQAEPKWWTDCRQSLALPLSNLLPETIHAQQVRACPL
jgi:hypothetical protein